MEKEREAMGLPPRPAPANAEMAVGRSGNKNLLSEVESEAGRRRVREGEPMWLVWPFQVSH